MQCDGVQLYPCAPTGWGMHNVQLLPNHYLVLAVTAKPHTLWKPPFLCWLVSKHFRLLLSPTLLRSMAVAPSMHCCLRQGGVELYVATLNESSAVVMEQARPRGAKVSEEGLSSLPSCPPKCEGQVGSFTHRTMFGHSFFVAGPYPCLSFPHIISLTTALICEWS